MKIGDLSAGATLLYESMKMLQEAWAETKTHWNDKNAYQFQETHLEPIAPKVKLAQDAINRLDEVLTQAQRECES